MKFTFTAAIPEEVCISPFKLTMEIDEECIDDVVEHFELFLRGCGYDQSCIDSAFNRDEEDKDRFVFVVSKDEQ